MLGLAIPIVRPLVLTLGSPEFFMLALLGITFVASLSGEALLKGLLAGGLGLWLATIGLDPVTGTQRYTFGQLFLWDGIGLVPVTIGFYAIPDLIEMATAGSSIAKLDVGRVGSVWEGLSLAGFAFVNGLFEKGLGVPFPPGQLFVWLGLGN